MRKNALEHAKKHHNNVYQEFSKLKDRVTKKRFWITINPCL